MGDNNTYIYFGGFIIFWIIFYCLLQTAGKRDLQQEAEAKRWIETVTGAAFPADLSYEDALRDGIILCKLMCHLAPGIIAKVNVSGGDYKMMDNISQ